jgi:hypothetical protein
MIVGGKPVDLGKAERHEPRLPSIAVRHVDQALTPIAQREGKLLNVQFGWR